MSCWLCTWTLATAKLLLVACLFCVFTILLCGGLFSCFVLWTMWKEDRFRHPEGDPAKRCE